MSTRSKLNVKHFLIVLSLILIFILSAYHFDKYKDTIKILLESRLLTISVWGYIAVTFTAHRVILGSNESGDSFIFSHFGKYADTVFAVGTYGLSSSTSLALIKGLYVQYFFETVFYRGFDMFDLISMFMLSSFLLIYSMFATTKAFFDLIFYSQSEYVKVSS